MTQVQTMTNAQLNRALAELMGYTVQARPPGENGLIWFELVRPNGKVDLANPTIDLAFSYAPAYCTDPAASLEVQTAAIAKDQSEYFTQLLELKGAILHYSLFVALRAVALATPRERAEAAYITLSSKQ